MYVIYNMLEQVLWKVSTIHMYVNKATYKNWVGGAWVQLNRYIIKGMVSGMGLHLLKIKVTDGLLSTPQI